MKPEHRKQIMIFSWVTAIFCAGGLVLVVLGIRSYNENSAFADGAQSAPGKVIGFETWEDPSRDLRENVTYAVVLYKTTDGREVRFGGPDKTSTEGLLAHLNKGDEVRVLYHPDDPEAARMDSFMGLWFWATMLCGVGAGAILVPLLTMWEAWKWAKRQGEMTGEGRL